jgi:hypothetical protein
MPDETKTAKPKGRTYDPTLAYLQYFEGRYTVSESRETEVERNGNRNGNGKSGAEVKKTPKAQKSKRKGR